LPLLLLLLLKKKTKSHNGWLRDFFSEKSLKHKI